MIQRFLTTVKAALRPTPLYRPLVQLRQALLSSPPAAALAETPPEEQSVVKPSIPPPSPAPSSQRADNPATGATLVIDFPYAEAHFPLEFYSGWYRVAGVEDPARLQLTVNGRPARATPIVRPDLPSADSHGFGVYLVLAEYLASAEGGILDFVLHRDDEPVVSLQFSVAAAVAEVAVQYPAWRQQRREFMESVLVCPACRQARPELEGEERVCGHCQARFPQVPGWDGVTMMAGEMEVATRLAHKTDPISAHVYSQAVVEQLEALKAEGGWALDVGAGLRRQSYPHLITTEIYDYPSTDVRCVGEALPFADGSFDLVISSAVLEHVPHPFLDAKELLRVLRPGGSLHVVVPFLQPEHGYPYHYFNMTRSGVLQLFGDAIRVERHFIDLANEPLFALNWIASVYYSHLPAEQQERFLNLRVADLVQRNPADFQHDPLITQLAPEAKWVIACGHILEARKN